MKDRIFWVTPEPYIPSFSVAMLQSEEPVEFSHLCGDFCS